MFLNRYIYKAKKPNRPDINGSSVGIRETPGIDTSIKEILNDLPKPNDFNNEAMFHLDNAAPTFVEMMAYTIIGDKIDIKTPDYKEAEKRIKRWCRSVNVKNQTLKDIVRIWILDNFIFNRTYWRVAHNMVDIVGNRRDLPDLQRMDPKSIKPIEDVKNGWEFLVQTVKHGETSKTPMQFMKGEIDSTPDKTSEIVIAKHIKYVLTDSYFVSAPME